MIERTGSLEAVRTVEEEAAADFLRETDSHFIIEPVIQKMSAEDEDFEKKYREARDPKSILTLWGSFVGTEEEPGLLSERERRAVGSVLDGWTSNGRGNSNGKKEALRRAYEESVFARS